mgnify:CR=1 FL=1
MVLSCYIYLLFLFYRILIMHVLLRVLHDKLIIQTPHLNQQEHQRQDKGYQNNSLFQGHYDR